MSYFHIRRQEILGKRKRKPRQCDVLKRERERFVASLRMRAYLRAIRRLESVWRAP